MAELKFFIVEPKSAHASATKNTLLNWIAKHLIYQTLITV